MFFTDYKKLGANIRHIRRAKCMTQAQLACAIQRSTAFIGHIERGTRVASLETLVLICDALNASVDEILGRRTARPRLVYRIVYDAPGEHVRDTTSDG